MFFSELLFRIAASTAIPSRYSHTITQRLLLGLTIAATQVLLFAGQAKQSKPANKAEVKQTRSANKGAPPPLTETDLATAKRGRDPNQPIDEEYTKKIKEYTTETGGGLQACYKQAAITRPDAFSPNGNQWQTQPIGKTSCNFVPCPGTNPASDMGP